MAAYTSPDFDVSGFAPSVYAEGTISGDLAQIETAIYGRDVRASIVESLYLIWVNQSDLNTALDTITEQEVTVAELQETVVALESAVETLENTVAAMQDYVSGLTVVASMSVGDAATAKGYGSGNIEITGYGDLTTALTSDFVSEMQAYITNGCAVTIASGVTSLCENFGNWLATAYMTQAFDYLPYWIIPSSVTSLGAHSVGTNVVVYGGTMEQWKTITEDSCEAFHMTVASQLTIHVHCTDGTLEWSGTAWEEA